MELKGGDEANDPFGYKLRNFGKIVRCCHFSIGELVESAGDASKGLFIKHARKCFLVDSSIAELDATHRATGFEKSSSPFFL